MHRTSVTPKYEWYFTVKLLRFLDPPIRVSISLLLQQFLRFLNGIFLVADIDRADYVGITFHHAYLIIVFRREAPPTQGFLYHLADNAPVDFLLAAVHFLNWRPRVVQN